MNISLTDKWYDYFQNWTAIGFINILKPLSYEASIVMNIQYVCLILVIDVCDSTLINVIK